MDTSKTGLQVAVIPALDVKLTKANGEVYYTAKAETLAKLPANAVTAVWEYGVRKILADRTNTAEKDGKNRSKEIGKLLADLQAGNTGKTRNPDAGFHAFIKRLGHNPATAKPETLATLRSSYDTLHATLAAVPVDEADETATK